MQSSHIPVHLSITGPDGAKSELTLDRESIMIGTDATAAVRLSDDKVSAVHAMLKCHASGQVSVLDLGSESGTIVGGQSVVNAPVPSGSILMVGRTSIQIDYPANGGTARVSAPAPRPAPRPAPAPARTAKAPAAKPAASHRTRAHLNYKPKRLRHITLSGTVEERSANATRYFLEALPEDQRPSRETRVLQITQLWGDTVVESRSFAPDEEATIGENGHYSVFAPEVGDSFTLARGTAEGFAVTVPDGAQVAVASGGKELSLDQLNASANDGASRGKAFEIGLEDRALMGIAGFTFVLRQVAPPKRFITNVWDEFDFYFSKVLSLTFLFFVTMVGAFFITPVHSESLSEDLFKNANRYAKYIVKPQEKPKKLLKDLSGVKEGAKAAKEEGKFGKKEAQKKEADPSKKGAPVVDANKRETDRKKVMSQLSWLSGGGGEGAASNIFGPGGLGTGINNALGGLQGGAGMGDAHGVGGLGSRGTGPGGGGTALGIGGLGTKGGGRGRGGYGSLDLGGKGKGDTQFDAGKTVVIGGLDKDTIARVIKRHWNEIKYCYEKELSKDPNLYGKVTVNFVIDGTGTVSEASIQQTTMNNENVESCMLSHVRRWRFPEPKGGGEVIVTYPWVFKPAG